MTGPRKMPGTEPVLEVRPAFPASPGLWDALLTAPGPRAESFSGLTRDVVDAIVEREGAELIFTTANPAMNEVEDATEPEVAVGDYSRGCMCSSASRIKHPACRIHGLPR